MGYIVCYFESIEEDDNGEEYIRYKMTVSEFENEEFLTKFLAERYGVGELETAMKEDDIIIIRDGTRVYPFVKDVKIIKDIGLQETRPEGLDEEEVNEEEPEEIDVDESEEEPQEEEENENAENEEAGEE